MEKNIFFKKKIQPHCIPGLPCLCSWPRLTLNFSLGLEACVSKSGLSGVQCLLHTRQTLYQLSLSPSSSPPFWIGNLQLVGLFVHREVHFILHLAFFTSFYFSISYFSCLYKFTKFLKLRMENPNFIFHGRTKYIVTRSIILPVSSKIYLVMLLLFFLKI